MSEIKLLKNGTACPIKKDIIHPPVTIPNHVLHPRTVWERRWMESGEKTWKNMALAVMNEYNIPTMMIVGRTNTAAGLPYRSINEP